MIMKGTTPRSLSWPACAGVLGLAVLLLPLLPVQAQTPAPLLTLYHANDQDSPDQQIEALKKAIRVLEEQKKADKKDGKPALLRTKPAPPKADPKEVEKARAEAEALAKQVETRRRELEEVIAKHHAAASKLSQLEGKSAHYVLRVIPGITSYQEVTTPAAAMIYTPVTTAPTAVPATGPYMVKPAVAYPPSLEQRLDRLMKEVEELRKELRKKSGGGASTPLSTSPAVVGHAVEAIIATPPPAVGEGVISIAPAAVPAPAISAAPAAAPAPVKPRPKKAAP